MQVRTTGRRMTGDQRRCACGLAALVAVVLVNGCAAPTGPQPAGRPGAAIGVVESQRILNETDAGKKALEKLEVFAKNRQAVVELEEKELRRMEETFIKQASVLSASAKKVREEQFRRRMMEYQQKVSQMNREVQDKQKEVLGEFHEKIEQAVTKLAQQAGLAVVVEKGKGSSTVYYEASIDLTAKVIEEINRGAQ